MGEQANYLIHEKATPRCQVQWGIQGTVTKLVPYLNGKKLSQAECSGIPVGIRITTR